MEISSDEMSLLQLYRTAKMQLGGMLPNLANLTLMSITPQNGMVAITQSTELFAQVPVDNEQIVSNPAPRTLPCNPTPQKRREHHLSTYPALQIRAAVRPRPMKNDHPKGRRKKGTARRNGPRQSKNWHDPQLMSGTTTWYR